MLFVGCYRIVRDSLVPLSLVPDRFGLDQTGSPIRNVVRSINVSGGMDSVLTTGDLVIDDARHRDRDVDRRTRSRSSEHDDGIHRGYGAGDGPWPKPIRRYHEGGLRALIVMQV